MTADGILNASVARQIMDSVAQVLAANGQTATVDKWGIRIKPTLHGYVYLERMTFTWRVKLIEDPDSRSCGGIGWCYPGDNLSLALTNAWAWDGSPTTEPSGWILAVHDGRRHGEAKDGITQVGTS